MVQAEGTSMAAAAVAAARVTTRVTCTLVVFSIGLVLSMWVAPAGYRRSVPAQTVPLRHCKAKRASRLGRPNPPTRWRPRSGCNPSVWSISSITLAVIEEIASLLTEAWWISPKYAPISSDV